MKYCVYLLSRYAAFMFAAISTQIIAVIGLLQIVGRNSYYPTPFLEIREAFEKGVSYHYTKCCTDDNFEYNNVSSCYIRYFNCSSYNMFRDSCINEFYIRYNDYFVIIVICLVYEVFVFFLICSLSHASDREQFSNLPCCRNLERPLVN